jgi:tRNA G26 N,N-dimethylase Trm1
MATTNRPSARHCPRCGAMGILPLDQPRGPTGAIKDLVMICPMCEDEFRATGATWLGAFRPPDLAKSIEDGTRQWAKDVAKVITNRARPPASIATDDTFW